MENKCRLYGIGEEFFYYTYNNSTLFRMALESWRWEDKGILAQSTWKIRHIRKYLFMFGVFGHDWNWFANN